MTIQQFTEGSFDEQKVNRHEVRQVLRGVCQLTPEEWAEARRKRAQEHAKGKVTPRELSERTVQP